MSIKKAVKVSSLFPLPLLLLPLFSIFIAGLLSPTPLSAETRYIAPSSEIAVRRGQGLDFKILAMVKDGTPVEFLEENESYARVRLSNGKKGWMLKRFLSDTPPLDEVVASLRSEKERLEEKERELMQSVEELSSNLARTREELEASLKEKNQIWTDFQALQQDTADVIRIKNEMVQTREANDHLSREMAAVKEDSERAKKNFAIKWFLAGGGVLLLGMFIGGTVSGKSRRRKSLQL